MLAEDGKQCSMVHPHSKKIMSDLYGYVREKYCRKMNFEDSSYMCRFFHKIKLEENKSVFLQ